jgi:hypothetical protein
MAEIAAASEALRASVRCDKLKRLGMAEAGLGLCGGPPIPACGRRSIGAAACSQAGVTSVAASSIARIDAHIL